MFGGMPPVSDEVFSTSTEATPPKHETRHPPLRAAPAGPSDYLLGTDQTRSPAEGPAVEGGLTGHGVPSSLDHSSRLELSQGNVGC